MIGAIAAARLAERGGKRVAIVERDLVVVASSDHTVVVEGHHYFPLQDVKRQYLEPSPRHSVCFWKGRASYYDLVVEGERSKAAAWYYPRPTPAAAGIKDHVAFWRGVKVRRAPSGPDG